MGVGSGRSVNGIRRGIDIFDCVLPTAWHARLAMTRTGAST
jgi:tRNA-guanine family transglycosylase